MKLMAQDHLISKPLYDFHQFLLEVQNAYSEIKENTQKQRGRFNHSCKDKFSSPFQNKYSELSSKFDQMIQSANINFQDHKIALEEEQQLIDQMILNIDHIEQIKLIHLVSKLLINSENIYDTWIQDEVSNLKEELDMVIGKNCQLQIQIGQLYEECELMKERIQEELSNRFQLEKYCRSLEKQLSALKEQNEEMTNSNKSLIASMKELDEQVEQTKQAQRRTNSSEAAQKDQLIEEKERTNSLEKENQILNEKLLSLQNQLEQIKNQQDNLIEEIEHLTEIIDNQNYELDFYKGKDLKESPSIIQQSFDQLNKYEDLLESYQNSSHKGSLKSFILSHQKSMGKLTIFEARDNGEDRVFEKISNPDLSLQSFEYVKVGSLRKEVVSDAYNFPDFNQMTFRPEADREVASSEQYVFKENEIDTNEEHVEFVVETTGQQTSRFEEQKDQNYQYRNDRGQPFIEPLNISGKKKHRRQRSQSITQGSPALITKRLIYDQMLHNQQNEIREEKHEETNEMIHENELQKCQENQLEKKSDGGYSEQKKTVRSFNPFNGNNHSRKYNDPQKDIEAKSEFKIHYRESTRKRTYHYNFDNRSEANSVNKALIKKNIRVQKQVEELKCKLQTAQQRIQIYEQKMLEYENEIKFYKQELSKNVQIGIRLKSEIEAYKGEIEGLEAERQENQRESEEKCKQYEDISKEIKDKVKKINELEIKIGEINDLMENQKLGFEERLAKVKDYCRTYIEEKHSRQISDLETYYESQLEELQKRLQTQSIKPIMIDRSIETTVQMSQISKKRQQYEERVLEMNFKSQLVKIQTQIQAELNCSNLYIHSTVVSQMVNVNYGVQRRLNERKKLNIQKIFSQKVQIKEINREKIKKKMKIFSFTYDIVVKRRINNFQLNSCFSLSICDFQHQSKDQSKLRISHSFTQNVKFQSDLYNKNLKIINTFNQVINFNSIKDKSQKLTLQSLFSCLVKPQTNKKSISINTQSQNLSICQTIQLQIIKPVLLKSPLLQRKQLLNTPSTLSLETKKLSPQTCKQQLQLQDKYQTSSQFSSSEHKFGSQVPIQLNRDLDETFKTVSFINDQLSVDHQFDEPNSFFTCVPFSSCESLRSDRDNKINNQNIFQQDIFVVEKDSQLQFLLEKPLEPMNDPDLISQQNDQKNQLEIVQISQLQVEKVETSLVQSIVGQNQRVVENPKSFTLENFAIHDQKTGKQLLSKFIPKVELVGESNLYSQVLEQNLHPYFKKNTTFHFTESSLPSESLPNQQKVYLLHAQKISNPFNFSNPNSFFEEQSQQPSIMQKFLFSKKMLLNIETGEKLEVPNGQMQKSQFDFCKMVLGNFEIAVTSKNELKISRKNKRCYYFGDIQDGNWKITKIQQIITQNSPIFTKD